jgi:hypothetical protein
MKKHILSSLLLVLLTLFKINAQDRELLARFPIMEEDSLKGYCFAYKELKAEKNMNKYVFTIYNKNLNQSDDIVFTIENDYTLNYSNNLMFSVPKQMIEIKNDFVFLMFSNVNPFGGNNSKKLIVIDLNKKIVITNKNFDENQNLMVDWKFLDNDRILKLSGDILPTELKKIEVFDYTLNKISDIDIRSESGRKVIFFNEIISVNKDFAAISVNNNDDKNYNSYIWLFSLKSGKIVNKMNFVSKEKDSFYGVQSIHNTGIKNEFVIIGSLNKYNGKKQMGVKLIESVGLFMKKINLKPNDSIVSIENMMPLNPFFDKLLGQNKDVKNPTVINFKNVFYSNQKLSFLISSGPPQHVILGTENSVSIPLIDGEKTASNKIKSAFFIIDADPNLNLKTISPLTGESNIDHLNFSKREVIDFNLNSNFDKTNNTLTMFGKVGKEGKNDTFVSIVYEKGKPLKTDEFPLNKDAEWTEFYPAKPGYVLIVEYFKKEKSLKKRLEKLNY